jgi:hypothetical protein
MPRRHRIPALLAAAVLSLGAASCGGDDSGDREDVDQSNEGQVTAPGSPSTLEKPATGLTSTGAEEPPVTQTETTP